MTDDNCPLSESGHHRYFIFKVTKEFEPYIVGPAEKLILEPELNIGPMLYNLVEYAISGCNCGSAVKQRVKQR